MALLEYLPPPAGSNPVWWPISGKQRTAIESPAKILLYGGGSGGGKGLNIDTPIPTPSGWTRMGDLRSGDIVFAEDGETCRITHVSEVNHRPCFRVEFNDDTTLVVDDVHRWRTLSYQERRNNDKRSERGRAQRRSTRKSRAVDNPLKPWVQKSITAVNKARTYEYLLPTLGSVVDTAEISRSLLGASGHLNHCIEVCKPLNLPTAVLPIDPYWLGCWLGDGRTNQPSIGKLADDMEEIASRSPYAEKSRKLEVGGKGAYKQNYLTIRFKGVLPLLCSCGLLGNKHIPSMYLRASIEQRIELLRGLLDTDGHIDKRGQIELGLSDGKLIADAHELVMSLGIKATIREKKTYRKTCYRIKFVCTFPAFHIKRKLARQNFEAKRDTTTRRYITAVVPVESVPTRCIAVDSPSHLYLAGKQMVPTHNTDYLVADAVQEVGNPNLRGLLLRKSFTEMNNIIDRMMAIYRPLGGHPSDGGKMWKFPSGAQIRLGYLAADADVEKYQGSPFTWLGVDEAGNQMEKRLRAILPWLASTDPTLRVRARLTANPGGVGADWLMRLFLKDKCPIHYPEESVEPGALYRGKKLTWTDGRSLDPTGKTTVSFIPALVGDNPLYGEEKIAMLQSQEGAISEKLLMGCWCALAGRYFNFLTPAHILSLAENPAQWWNTHIISIDYGFGESWAAAGLYYVSEPSLEFPEGRMFKMGECLGVDPETGEKLGSEDFAKLVVKTFVVGRIEIAAAYCDPANDGHTGNGRSNLEIMAEVFSAWNIPMLAAHKDRIANWQNLYRMLKKGQVVVTDTCPVTFKSLNTRMHDPKRPGDIKKVDGNYLDDFADETSYAANTYFAGDAKPKEVQQAEKLAGYVAAGMDEHSLNIHRQKMQMEADDDSDDGFEPVRMTRVGGPRVMRRG